MDSGIADTKQRLESLRQSLTAVRPQSAAMLLADMLGTADHDLSAACEDASPLRPAPPALFKDLIQPYEASVLHASWSTSECRPVSASGFVDLHENRVSHDMTHCRHKPGTTHKAQAGQGMEASTAEHMTPRQSETSPPTAQPLEQAQPFKFAALRTPGCAAQVAQPSTYPPHKAAHHPTSPHTPAMLDVISQQRKKRSLADMTDAQEDWVGVLQGDRLCRCASCAPQ